MSLKYLGNDKQNASPNVPTGKTYSAICNKTHRQTHARLLFVMAMVNIEHNTVYKYMMQEWSISQQTVNIEFMYATIYSQYNCIMYTYRLRFLVH